MAIGWTYCKVVITLPSVPIKREWMYRLIYRLEEYTYLTEIAITAQPVLKTYSACFFFIKSSPLLTFCIYLYITPESYEKPKLHKYDANNIDYLPICHRC